MKRILILAIACLMGSVLSAQDCYDNLLNKGMKEYNAGNYDKALIKWKAALEDCPELTSTQRRNLNDWIAKAQNPEPVTFRNDFDTLVKYKSVNPLPKKKYEPEMIYVQGATFQMGSNEENKDEKPLHIITLDDFYIGKYEVTVEQFAIFIKETGYVTTSENADTSFRINQGQKVNKKEISYKQNAKDTLRSKLENRHPVINISWLDANAYCNWLSKMTGYKYRLPTEAEWEYAARGGNKSIDNPYSGGYLINDVAWFSANSNSMTHQVGLKQPNQFGIFDMSGNVWEWCNDWYKADYYDNSPEKNPQGANLGQYKVCRGCSWRDNNKGCRITFRLYYNPTFFSSMLGFRVVREN